MGTQALLFQVKIRVLFLFIMYQYAPEGCNVSVPYREVVNYDKIIF